MGLVGLVPPVKFGLGRPEADQEKSIFFNLRSTRERIGITVAISIVMIGLWFRFETPIAILPALLTLVWITLSASKQRAPVPVSGKRLMFFALAIGVIALLIIVGVFVILR